MRQTLILRAFTALVLCAFPSFPAWAFDSGAHLQLSADFLGSLSLPSIPLEDLRELNPAATGMGGLTGAILAGGQVEAGYIFRSHDFLGLSEDNPFSGLGAFLYLGFSQGDISQKISAEVDGASMDIFINVFFVPIINFGATLKSYFFDNHFALALSLGGRVIADLTPEYLCWSTEPAAVPTEIGTIIVSEDMMKSMNPLMFCVKFGLEYNVIILPSTELVLGAFARFNAYVPKYLTVPPKLQEMALAANPDFDINKPFPNYRLDSLDFGVSLGLAFKL